MKVEEFIKQLIEKYDNPSFEADADWWDWGNVGDAHAHGVDEGMQYIVDKLKTFKTKEK
jgi:hypothetical protein